MFFHAASIWYFVLPGMILYIIDKARRLARESSSFQVFEVTALKSDITFISIKKNYEHNRISLCSKEF